MRRSLSSPRRSLLRVGLLMLGFTGRLVGQTGEAVESPYFLIPIGARSLGMGQAAVASGGSSESVWWNPALIASAPRELAFNLAQQANGAIATDASAALLWPVPRVGTFGVTIRYIS